MGISVEIYEVALTSAASGSNWNLEVLVFEEEGKTGGPGEKTLGARARTNNKLNTRALTPLPPPCFLRFY